MVGAGNVAELNTSTNGGRFAYRSHSINDSNRRRRRASLEVIDEEELDEQTNVLNRESSTNNAGDDITDQSSTNTSTDFRLLLTSRNTQLLNFYASILSPFLESYWQTAEQLALLADANPHKEYDEKHVHRQLCTNLQQLHQKSQLKHGELSDALKTKIDPSIYIIFFCSVS